MKQETWALAQLVTSNLHTLAEMVREDTKEAIASDDHVAVIKHYDRLRTVTDQVKEAREVLDQIKERLSREDVPSVMRAHNVKTITVEGVGRVSLSNRWSCSMLDKPLALDWLRKSGNGGLIQETVNSSTLAAFAKNLTETEGKELPGELFKTGIMTITSITKAK